MSISMEKPKMKILKTKSEWVWDIVGYAFLLGSIFFLIYNWSSIPSKVPAHYNFLGEVDRWGSKTELLVLPILGAVIAVFLQLIEKFPEAHNYPKRFNQENAREFYLTSRKMVNRMKNICLMIFALILVESISIALGWRSPSGKWLIPLILVSVSIPIVLGMIKQKKIK